MEAIARAARSGQLAVSRSYVVIADRRRAGGLARAAALGIPTAVVPVERVRRSRHFDRGARAPSSTPAAPGSWRWPASCASCRREFVHAFRGPAAQHPSLAAAEVQGPGYARARARGGRFASTAPACISSPPSSTAGRWSCRGGFRSVPADTQATLSARVHALGTHHLSACHCWYCIAAGVSNGATAACASTAQPLLAPTAASRKAMRLPEDRCYWPCCCRSTARRDRGRRRRVAEAVSRHATPSYGKGITAGTTDARARRAAPTASYIYASRGNARGMFRMPCSAMRSRRPAAFDVIDGRVRADARSRGRWLERQERDISLDFDWQRKRVTGVAKDETVDLELPERARRTRCRCRSRSLRDLLRGASPESTVLARSTPTRSRTTSYTSKATRASKPRSASSTP